jgi:hypothetical protein
LDNEGLRGLLIASAPDVATLPRHSLADDLPAIMRASGEEARAEPAAAGRKGPESKEHRQSVTSSPTPIVLWQASARHLGGWGWEQAVHPRHRDAVQPKRAPMHGRTAPLDLDAGPDF